MARPWSSPIRATAEVVGASRWRALSESAQLPKLVTLRVAVAFFHLIA